MNVVAADPDWGNDGSRRLWAACINLAVPRLVVLPASESYSVENSEAAEARQSADIWDLDVVREPDSFLQLYRLYYDSILNYLYRRTHDLESAQDLTSQTFLKALENLKRRPQRLRVKPWLYRIATNLHCSHYRSSRRWVQNLPFVGRHFERRAVTMPDERLERESEAGQIRAAVANLPERHRSPLLLRYYEGLSCNELAEVLGIRPVSVRSRMARALHALERELHRESLS
jgi:RNA polymerase sigma-70 factor, ECF subfamily